MGVSNRMYDARSGLREIAMANALLLAAFDFSGAHADEFHDWYDLEHIPERQAIAGFGACERWISADQPGISIAIYNPRLDRSTSWDDGLRQCRSVWEHLKRFTKQLAGFDRLSLDELTSRFESDDASSRKPESIAPSHLVAGYVSCLQECRTDRLQYL